MSETFEPHPMNAPGPFYVADGYCMACGIPIQEAPDHFAWSDSDHCYVKRQPGTKEEVNNMLMAMWCSETQCIRYRGQDADILRRLAERDDADLCDFPPPANIQPVLRNIVTFDASCREVESMTPQELALAFQDYARSEDSEFTPIIADAQSSSFSYSWYQSNFHPVQIQAILMPDCRWLLRHSPIEKASSLGMSNVVDGWLKRDGLFCKVRWYTKEQWNGSKEWQETPM